MSSLTWREDNRGELSAPNAPQLRAVCEDNTAQHRAQLRQKLLDLGMQAPRAISEAVDCAKFHVVKADEILLAQGGIADRLFVVLEGELEVFKQDPDGTETVHGRLFSGDVAGKLAYVRAQTGPQRMLASVRAKKDTVVASLSWNHYGTLETSIETNLSVYRCFSQQAAHQLEQSSTYVLEESKINAQRVQTFAVLLATILFVMSSYALFVALYLHSFNDSNYSFAAMTLYTVPANLITVAILVLNLKKLALPRQTFGLDFSNLAGQFTYGIVMTIPVIFLMAGVRYLLDPSVNVFSFHFLVHQVQGPFDGWKEFAFASFYALVMCPGQQFIVRCGVQVPISWGLGPNKLSSALWGNLAASLAFASMHVLYSNLAVFLTLFASLYWGVMFQYRRSWIAVATGHAISGIAAFYWFGLLHLAQP
ncbi:DNA-binding transcriptional dual regulator Crp [Pseudovibrio axinellae]|uniref:DNA-binding transcriptional dual regulator Crp n=1 Tax=Pseudovibrio axinellae TaxID=989403 RepID=A0A165YUB6_9HYPH|nr:cyclic nucleotide-binding domain-containing protein [Pseudovibrio axinellae]KZL19243.1 DNA-binding transcriptional dual regulator Crp [Pseudovibrio axinellae]SEQ44504.1 cAMP-binding domain of CRP or a regulatory subunit of cAMP-dependent protein kinases [Pseudovibrio axinellae]